MSLYTSFSPEELPRFSWLRGFVWYSRETSLIEAWKQLVWWPFVCRLRGHQWKEWKTYVEEVPFTPVEECWECLRCNVFVYDDPADSGV